MKKNGFDTIWLNDFGDENYSAAEADAKIITMMFLFLKMCGMQERFTEFSLLKLKCNIESGNTSTDIWESQKTREQTKEGELFS